MSKGKREAPVTKRYIPSKNMFSFYFVDYVSLLTNKKHLVEFVHNTLQISQGHNV